MTVRWLVAGVEAGVVRTIAPDIEEEWNMNGE